MARHACGMGLQVCLWHKADMLNALANVCFWVESGHGPRTAKCLLVTQSGHSHTNVPNTLEPGSDLLVGLAGLSLRFEHP